ncbi:MAG TPA: SH3 domain-containing protein [Phototrophicaceae bacterium]|nr:SH3 domain-containing protein [Phototrophicaceae bacterium]
MLHSKASLWLRFLSLALIFMVACAVLPAQAQADFPCSDLARQTNGDITVDFGSDTASSGVKGAVGDIFCRVIVRDGGVNTSLSEIGVSWLINQPIVQAVNVYGMAQGTSLPYLPDTLVCLRGQGTLYDLSVFDKTATPTEISAFPTDRIGYTCTYLSFAGTVVLVGSLNVAPAAIPIQSVPSSLPDCQVTTRANLHVRSLPGTTHPIVTTLPPKTTLPVVSHYQGWYLVVYASNNTQGWVSGAYVTATGNCN